MLLSVGFSSDAILSKRERIDPRFVIEHVTETRRAPG
jgi:hypothetical protein